MFEKYTKEQYRALDADGFEARRAEVAAAIDAFDGSDPNLTMDDLKAEVRMIQEDAERRELAANLRSARAAQVAGGAGRVISAMAPKPATKRSAEDVFDSIEYRTAFMNNVVKGAPMPEQFREATTISGTYMQSTDVPVNVPTTLQAEVIKKMEERGSILAAVRKTSLRAGIEFRVRDLQVSATWIAENQVSAYQKPTDDTTISFKYYELECRIAQTLLAAAVTLSDFEAAFVDAVSNAMVDALETAILRGTGKGQPLGITVDPRVTNVVELTEAQVNDWVEWHKQVKASIPRLYRRRGSFIFGQGTWDSIVEVLRDSQNHPVSTTGYNPVTGEEQLRLMGIPVQLVDDAAVPDFAGAKGGDVFGVFGDLSNYLLNTQPGMPLTTVKWIDHDNNLEKTKALLACDGRVLDPYGFVLLKKKTA